MIIKNAKNAAFIFDPLTNNLSMCITFKTIDCSSWTNINGKAGFDPIADCYNPKQIRITITRPLLKKNDPFFVN